MKLAKTYTPDNYEPNTYALWEVSGAFAPTGQGDPYCIVLPPPNANGNLHVGHALTVHLQDILVRHARMNGHDVAYIPGSDHAGFETWVVYERELNKQGKSRFDFARDQLYSQVWNFVDQQRGSMELQLRALGASLDWQSAVFTLDQKAIDTTYQTFKQLWDDGLIYRGERIVNYSTAYQTSYADIEVEYREEQGTLWQIAYPTLDHIGEIVIATTRPETLLGDTAIAVHPDDKRYQHLIGSRVLLPLVEREIPVVADEYVDPSYGTGAVKVTPAHDPNDFEIGERHNLPRIQVIGFDGRMINVPAPFAGLTVEEAREQVLAALASGEYRRGEQPITHTVGYDYKSGLPIQPMVKEQWFVRVAPLVQRAKAAIESGQISFTPASKAKALLQYYDNLRDWNISRQIPWGIPIPAFQNQADPTDWIFDTRVDQPTITINGATYRREEDTFDTWFSSGQWPFIVTDYTSDGPLARFYPTSVLETGHDILYPWISRMIMLGLYRTGQVPFRHVYLHGLVLDEYGQKMSKSKGNVVNPMEMVATYGSDALRLGLVAARSAGQNQAFSPSKVVAGRNFCNKLWNMARFVEARIGDQYQPGGDLTPITSADHWVIRQLNQAAATVDEHLANYRFAEAAETVYHTIWDDVADWYIEASKVTDSPAMLAWALDTCLKLAHPFAPFVTETIWQTLGWHDDLLIRARWPRDNRYNPVAAAAFGRVQDFVSEVRYVLAELPGKGRYDLLYRNDGLIEDNHDLIRHLTTIGTIVRTDSPRGLRLAIANHEAWVDIDADTLYEHQTNLEVRLANTRQRLAGLEARLANEAYVAKAPQHLVEETRQQVDEYRELVKRLQRELTMLIE